jgi:O-antigen/teichoic acid export membrane protein
MTIPGKIKQLSKDTLLYGVGNALQSFIGFLLFPIYTRVLTQVDFGTQDLVLTAVTITSYFLILGLDSGAARNYYDENSEEHKKTVLSTWLWFELALSIPACILLGFFAPEICKIIFNNAGLAHFFRLGMVLIPISMVARVNLLTLRLTFQAKKFSIVAAIGALSQALVAILLVVIFHLGIEGVFYAMIAGNIVQVVLGLTFARSNFRFRFSKQILKAMLVFGIPLVPASISLWILNSSNRYFLTRLGTLDQIGILAVGTRISLIINLFITAFSNAWPPFAYSLLHDRELARKTYARVLTLFLLGTGFVALGISIFSREGTSILATSKYNNSAALIPWLVFSAISWGLVNIVGIGFEIEKKSYHFSVSTVLGALVTTGMNIIFIPRWGVVGAAVATLMGNLVALVYNFCAGQHYFPVSYEYRKITIFVILTTFAVIAGSQVDALFPIWQPSLLILKTAIIGIFILAVIVLRVISWSEIRNGLKYIYSQFPGAKTSQSTDPV